MPNNGVTFLMYHELQMPGRQLCQSEPGYVRYVLAESSFRAQVNYLKQNGWRGQSVGEALEFAGGKNVVITFDDGCETDLLAAAPILGEAGFNATFFVTRGRLEQRGFLSQSQLKQLSVSGFEIGCHSMTHAYLSDLDESGLHREVVDAKEQLEQIIGRAVKHFSCPGGRWSKRVADLARQTGYHSVSTSRIQRNSMRTNPFALGRVAIFRGTALESFAAICEGRSLLIMRTRSSLHETARQVLGNRFYEQVRARLLRRQNIVS